ncbi:MAG: metal-dependent hydrolase [Rubrobacter sp.]
MEALLGGVRITYLGHSTFRFTTPGDEQIIIDPFINDNPVIPQELKEVGELDTILVTHGHFDHLGDASQLSKDTGAKVIANFEVFSYLQSIGVENAEPIQKGGTAQIGGIKLTATNAFHSSSIQTEDGSSIYGGEPMGYVIEFESGLKLYHAGDTCLFGDMSLIGELYGPDIAILPIGDRLTMGPLEAAHAAKLLGVKHVIPAHYDPNVLPFFTGTPKKLQERLAEVGHEAEVITMSPGDHLSS